MKIGILGQGYVGTAIKVGFEPYYPNLNYFDKFDKSKSSVQNLEELVKLYLRFPNCGSYCSRYKIQNSKENFTKPHFKGISDDFYGVIPNYFRSNYPFKINNLLEGKGNIYVSRESSTK